MHLVIVNLVEAHNELLDWVVTEGEESVQDAREQALLVTGAQLELALAVGFRSASSVFALRGMLATAATDDSVRLPSTGLPVGKDCRTGPVADEVFHDELGLTQLESSVLRAAFWQHLIELELNVVVAF